MRRQHSANTNVFYTRQYYRTNEEKCGYPKKEDIITIDEKTRATREDKTFLGTTDIRGKGVNCEYRPVEISWRVKPLFALVWGAFSNDRRFTRH